MQNPTRRTGSSSAVTGPRNDLLSSFMALDSSFTDAYLVDVVLNFMIAGRDTTGQTLSWMFYLFPRAPKHSKIHGETYVP